MIVYALHRVLRLQIAQASVILLRVRCRFVHDCARGSWCNVSPCGLRLLSIGAVAVVVVLFWLGALVCWAGSAQPLGLPGNAPPRSSATARCLLLPGTTSGTKTTTNAPE